MTITRIDFGRRSSRRLRADASGVSRCRQLADRSDLKTGEHDRKAGRKPRGSRPVAPKTVRPYDRRYLVQAYDLPFKIISAVIRSSSAKPTDFQTVMSVSVRLKLN